MMDEERLQVLKMIEAGKITPEQGLSLMQALDRSPQESTEALEPGLALPADEQMPDDMARVVFESRLRNLRRLWLLGLFLGLDVTLGAAYWMYSAWQKAAGVGGWFFVALVIFLLGVFLLAVAYASRTSRWIYINIRQHSGEKPGRIVLVFPLLLPAAMLKFAGQYVDEKERAVMDEVLAALVNGSALNEPLFVEVNEADGEHVQIYIG